VLPGGDAPSSASAVATTPDASVGFPVKHIIIVGAPVKIIMSTTNTRWNYPTPHRKRRAANNCDTAVAAIGVVRNERGRSLSHEDQGSRRQVP